MPEDWSIDYLIGIGTIFLNPLFYWGVLLLILVSLKRVKRERNIFGFKIYPLFSEVKNSWIITLIASVVISSVSLIFGLMMTLETIIILSVITILLTITRSLKLLSAAYTIGITFIVLYSLQYVNVAQIPYIHIRLDMMNTQFISLALLAALLLIVESFIVRKKVNRPTYPDTTMSNRGRIIGLHRLKKFAFVPFLILVPTSFLKGFAPFFPLFEYGNESISIVLLPFFIGIHFDVKGTLPKNVMSRLSNAIFLLGIIVLLLAVGSLYVELVSIIAIAFALLGRIYIAIRFRRRDERNQLFFRPLNEGIKVLAVIPNGPADRLGIKPGETIYKVNGIVITNNAAFYAALQNSGAFFRLEVLDYADEVRFITSAFYEQDHHELGIVFPNELRT